jgi:hypothetical protein
MDPFLASFSRGLKKAKLQLDVIEIAQKIWSGRPGSNRRRPAWEAGILPLNYARSGQGRVADKNVWK